MKKLFLIIAIALLSATSCLAYNTMDLFGKNGGSQSTSCRPNVSNVYYFLEVLGTGSSYVQADFNTGGGCWENISNVITRTNPYFTTITQGQIEAPVNGYISSLRIEIVGGSGFSFQWARASW